MLNRRPPIKYRRNQYSANQPSGAGIADTDIIKEVASIPLPNESEKTERLTTESEESRGFPTLDLFGKTLSLDMIILVGLIFLLIQERVEDDFLLILLVYILLF